MGDTDVIRKHIEIVQGLTGPRAKIAGSRIRVLDIVAWHKIHGMSIAELIENFPTITEADIYAALAYYSDNKEEIEAEFAAIDSLEAKYFKDAISPAVEEWRRRRRGNH